MLVKMMSGLALLGLAATLAAPAQDGKQDESGKYKVDPAHSSLVFRVQHLGAAYFWGRFNGVQGTMMVDHDVPEESYVEIQVAAKDIDTGNGGRDDHLRGPDFFDAKQFPDITFTSTAVEEAKPGVFQITGELSLHGVTKEITFEAVHSGHGKASERFGYRTGYEAEFTIDRNDFGISYMPGGLGDQVKIIVSLECAQA